MGTLAVMQPYFMPYVGYFQLMHAVDRFVLFDDVAYINKGWINRNRICVAGQPHAFTVPLAAASQNRTICEHLLFDDGKWKPKLLATIKANYRGAVNYAEAYALIEKIVLHPAQGISEYVAYSLNQVCAYLEITTAIVPTSGVYANQQMKAQERILDICRQENAGVYVNSIGGQHLYQAEAFSSQNVKLRFLQSQTEPYQQSGTQFHANLSIIDVLMHNSQSASKNMLNQYTLVPGS